MLDVEVGADIVPCFQTSQLGRASEANARLLKMSAIENTIPNTIPVTTVFMEFMEAGPNPTYQTPV